MFSLSRPALLCAIAALCAAMPATSFARVVTLNGRDYDVDVRQHQSDAYLNLDQLAKLVSADVAGRSSGRKTYDFGRAGTLTVAPLLPWLLHNEAVVELAQPVQQRNGSLWLPWSAVEQVIGPQLPLDLLSLDNLDPDRHCPLTQMRGNPSQVTAYALCWTQDTGATIRERLAAAVLWKRTSSLHWRCRCKKRCGM